MRNLHAQISNLLIFSESESSNIHCVCVCAV